MLADDPGIYPGEPTKGTPEQNHLRMERAHMAARGAWLYPADHEVREDAITACLAINIDYIQLVAALIEQNDRPGATMSVTMGRRLAAENLRTAADTLLARMNTPKLLPPTEGTAT